MCLSRRINLEVIYYNIKFYRIRPINTYKRTWSDSLWKKKKTVFAYQFSGKSILKIHQICEQETSSLIELWCSDFVSFKTKLRANFYPTLSTYCRAWNKLPSIVKIPIFTWELDDHNHVYLTRFETHLSFAKMQPQRNFIFVSSHRISFTLFVSGNLNHPVYTYLFSL